MPNYYQYPYPVQYPAPAQNAPQIQSGGFVSVPNEMAARNYPVAPGNSVTFKDETAPYVYTKTMGFSQLDRPVFEKFKLVKETPVEPAQEPQDERFDVTAINSTIDGLKGEIEAIWGEINGIKDSAPGRKAPAKRKEADDE